MTQIVPFGTLSDGSTVDLITLEGGGLSAAVLTYGATVQDLRIKGSDRSLVLGSDTLAGYLNGLDYFGAIVGRFANRIGNAQFAMGDNTFQTDPNFRGRHTLHGGSAGTGKLVWRIEDSTGDRVRLGLTLPDGHMGFPGEMTVAATFHLSDHALSVEIEARTTKASPCSFAHHGYFSLDDAPDIMQHSLQIAADHYLPVDDDLIPTGEVAPVEETRFDFRQPREIGGSGYDHNFCLSSVRWPVRPVAWLESRQSRLRLEVVTTEPGLQVYDGAHLGGLIARNGTVLAPKAGIALETQIWPDAPNRAEFPNAILHPGQTYRSLTRYRIT